MRITFKLNNTVVQIEIENNERLSTILRREFSLLSLKSTSLQNDFSACTILLNDNPVPASIVPAFNAEGKEIITLEYFKNLPEYKKIITAFKQAGVEMCGFCNSGKIFTAYKIMQTIHIEKEFTDKHEKTIKELYAGQNCRCSVSDTIVDAMKKLLKNKD